MLRELRLIPQKSLDKIYINLIRLIHLVNINSNIYLFVLTYSRLRYRQAFPTITKKASAQVINSFINQIRTRFLKVIKIFFSNSRGEFRNSKVIQHYRELGIRIDVSALYTPKPNRTAKSSNKTIISKARAIIINSGIPLATWNFAIKYIYYITNRLGNLKTKAIPIQQFKEDLNARLLAILNLLRLRRFGYKAYMYTYNHAKLHKFKLRAQIAQFIRFQENLSINYLLQMPFLQQNIQHYKPIFILYVSFYKDYVQKTAFSFITALLLLRIKGEDSALVLVLFPIVRVDSRGVDLFRSGFKSSSRS